MAIKVIETPTIYLTVSELQRYQYEYEQAFRMYCGPRPDFDEWVAAQVKAKNERRARCMP